jgi:hypothetical protein
MTVEVITDSSTIAESKEWLSENRHEGVDCPSCGELVKVYRHPVDSAMARTLILMYRAGGTEAFVHTPSLPGDTHKASQLKWWGFVEEERILRPDGGRAGYWRVTDVGERWINGESAPKYAYIFNGKVIDLSEDASATITDALGTKFNFMELMNAV